MAYSCTPSGATDAASGPPRRGSARLPAARGHTGEATNRPLGGEHETKDRPATGWNAADGFAAPRLQNADAAGLLPFLLHSAAPKKGSISPFCH